MTLPSFEYMPGGWLELHAAPMRQPITHRNIRSLHALMTQLIGGHDDAGVPRFVLRPYPDGVGWSVYIADQALALRIAGRTHAVDLRGHAMLFRCGPMKRVRAPKVPDQYVKLILKTLTPIVVRGTRNGAPEHLRSHTVGSEKSLLSALASLSQRCAVSRDIKIRTRFLANDTRPQSVRLGSPIGTMTGWAGTVVMEANPGAHWLLRAAELIGLGGRTAYGFGHITIEDLG